MPSSTVPQASSPTSIIEQVKTAYDVLLLAIDPSNLNTLMDDVQQAMEVDPKYIVTVEALLACITTPFQWVEEHTTNNAPLEGWWLDFQAQKASPEFANVIKETYAIDGQLRAHDVAEFVRQVLEDMYQVLVNQPIGVLTYHLAPIAEPPL